MPACDARARLSTMTTKTRKAVRIGIGGPVN
jgi:hypothetical protein